MYIDTVFKLWNLILKRYLVKYISLLKVPTDSTLALEGRRGRLYERHGYYYARFNFVLYVYTYNGDVGSIFWQHQQ